MGKPDTNLKDVKQISNTQGFKFDFFKNNVIFGPFFMVLQA
jgi:hypothetical protein